MKPMRDQGVIDLRPPPEPRPDGDFVFEPPSQAEADVIRWHLAAARAARNRIDEPKEPADGALVFDR